MRWLSILFLSGVAAPRPGFSAPRLHEVFYDAEGADSAHVFTELWGPPGTRLNGFRLVGIDGGSGLLYRSLDLTGAVFPADGLLVIATVNAIGELLWARDFIADVDWQNGPDAVQLRDGLGAVVDALQYGNAGRFGAGEGGSAPDPPSGFSLSRDSASRDTGDNAADFEVSMPTPGTGLGAARVPEPVSPTFLLLGFAAFWWWNQDSRWVRYARGGESGTWVRRPLSGTRTDRRRGR